MTARAEQRVRRRVTGLTGRRAVVAGAPAFEIGSVWPRTERHAASARLTSRTSSNPKDLLT
ncbi:hypothetical protein [Streptomyces sp. TRM68416]|uniref:hypothetical protein n=1 Tax=Streptomyces sp. TRM68416 TaxID=2758412 RepID=UPI001661B7DB|nr:hypothetical protein [Streptomyces sp. TRM68416]MBD0842495.1 hypothetical protein [Streptomyces sp. TRM68416]